jgi:hypothetical protein
MEQERLENMLIDYIDGNLNEVDKQVIERELLKNTALFKRYEELKEVMHVMDRAPRFSPSDELRISFEQLLKEEIRKEQRSTFFLFQPVVYRAAAAVALLVLVGSVGYFIRENQVQREEMAVLKEEMMRTRALVLGQLNDEQSATQRILGVKAAYQTAGADDAIVKALIATMNTDNNTNVRLAAVEALGKFQKEPQVRTALIDALSTQTDPLVQIALIQLMVQMKATEAVKPLQKIIDDEQSLPAVKDEAHAGIFRLS